MMLLELRTRIRTGKARTIVLELVKRRTGKAGTRVRELERRITGNDFGRMTIM